MKKIEISTARKNQINKVTASNQNLGICGFVSVISAIKVINHEIINDDYFGLKKDTIKDILDFLRYLLEKDEVMFNEILEFTNSFGVNKNDSKEFIFQSIISLKDNPEINPTGFVGVALKPKHLLRYLGWNNGMGQLENYSNISILGIKESSSQKEVDHWVLQIDNTIYSYGRTYGDWNEFHTIEGGDYQRVCKIGGRPDGSGLHISSY